MIGLRLAKKEDLEILANGDIKKAYEHLDKKIKE